MKPVSIVLLLWCVSLCAAAQTTFGLTGTVTDTAGVALPGAHVRLVTDKDTLHTTTGADGAFTISARTGRVQVQISNIGFQNWEGSLGLMDNLGIAVVLTPSSSELNEVVIRSAVQPVRIKKDTLEYNANGYTVHPNDRVEDLLRQLPGIDVDADGHITTNGKPLTKIRVNGKDFFTGNVRDFIRQIPAEMIAKLQVIDDYGDAANFTGDKNAAPKKILNLVTKPKRNSGRFGNLSLAGGIPGRYDLNLEANIWEENQHIGTKAELSNTNTGAGLNKDQSASLNYRNNPGRDWNLAVDYRYHANQNQLSQQNEVTTVNDLGTIYNSNSSRTDQANTSHAVLIDLKKNSKKDFFNAGANLNWDRSLSTGQNISAQSGLIRQDLATREGQVQKTPQYQMNLIWSRKMSRPGRLLTFTLNTERQQNEGSDTLRNRITYYDQAGELPVKDSLLNRLLVTGRTGRRFKAGFKYTEPFTETDSVKRNIGFFYDYAVHTQSGSLVTRVGDLSGYDRIVDSLSNNNGSTFRAHYAGVSYNYETKKLNYQLRVTAQPNLLTGNIAGGTATEIRRSDFNLGAALILNYRPGNRQQLQFFYFGDNTPPQIEQLQPVPDTRNLQNVVIGNPLLKTEFNHSMNISYRYVWPGSGAALQADVDGALVRNQVVSNVRLVKDTLNSLKQETRFLNANGNHRFGGELNISLPFSANRFTVELRAGLYENRQVVYTDDVEQASDGLMTLAGADLRLNQKRLSLRGGVSYTNSSNTYTVLQNISSSISSWRMHCSGKYFFNETGAVSIDVQQIVNKGYGVGSTDPFLLNANLEQGFFKKKQALLRLQANDIFGQGNALARQISANSITDSKSNVLTRYFLLSFIFRLESFG
jgi:hypothetical protein